MYIRSLLISVFCCLVGLHALCALEQQKHDAPFFSTSEMDAFNQHIAEKAAGVTRSDATPIELLERAYGERDKNPDLSESLICASIACGWVPQGYEKLGLFYLEKLQHQSAAKAFALACTEQSMRVLGNLFTTHLSDENRAANAYLLSGALGNAEAFATFLKAKRYVTSDLRETMKKQLRRFSTVKGSTMVCDLFLRSLTEGNKESAQLFLEGMGDHNWLVYPEHAEYLLSKQQEWFGSLVYEKKDPLARELFMRILEMSDRRCLYLPLATWCSNYHLAAQPELQVPSPRSKRFLEWCEKNQFASTHQEQTTHFERFSPEWYHLQQVRYETYVDFYSGIDVKERLIEFAHTIGEQCFNRVDMTGDECFERYDYGDAVRFLHPATQLQDPQARELLTAICLANPQYIVPDQAWMLPAAEQVVIEKGAHAQVLQMNILMGLGVAEREQAFQLFFVLRADRNEAYYAARYCSKSLAEYIEQLAECGDVPAIKLFAIRSILLGTNVLKAYSLIQSIADRSNPSVTYLYTALAERMVELPDRERSTLLSYHNLARSGERMIRQYAINDLGQYAKLGSPLAKKLLWSAENTMGDIPTLLNAVAPLSCDAIRANLIDWYLETLQKEKVKNLSRDTAFAVLLCGNAEDRDGAFTTLITLIEDKITPISMEMLPPAVRAHLMQYCDQQDVPALLIRALMAIAEEKFEEIPQAVMTVPHQDNPWIIYIQSAKAEYDARRDVTIASHVAGYTTLLTCGVPYLESRAEEALTRCTKNNDVTAQALLFCHCCQKYSDARKAIAVVAANAVAKPFYQYLNQYCLDRLIKASERHAFAAYILGKCYEQKVIEFTDDEQQRLQYMQLAMDAYLKAETGGHSCATLITPLAIYLAVSYRAAHHDQQAASVEQTLYHYGNPTEIEKGFKAWLASKRAQQEHVGYILGQLERLASKNAQLALEIADWYCNGKQWTNGCELKVDEESALRCATLAAKQNSQDGQLLKARLILKQGTASANEIDKAIRFLQCQKTLDPDTQALVTRARDQEDKKDREAKLEQRTKDLELLRAANDGDSLVADAIKRLEKLAGNGDVQALKAVGLRLMTISDDTKNIANIAKKACPMFESYYKMHPEDGEIYPAYIRALFYRHSGGDYQKAYEVLKKMSAKADVSSEICGIIAYKNNDFQRAIIFLSACGPSTRALWYKALAIFNYPAYRALHLNDLFAALNQAFRLPKDGLEVKCPFDDGDTLIQWLCAQNDQRVYSVLARLSLIMKNNKTLHAYFAQHKDDFRVLLVWSMEHHEAARAVGVFAFRHKLWGLHEDPQLMRLAVDYCFSILKRRPRTNWVQDELEEQSFLLSQLFFSACAAKEIEIPLSQAFILVGFCALTYSMMIIDGKREGLDYLIRFERELRKWPYFADLRNNFLYAFPTKELYYQATVSRNELARYALIVSYANSLVKDKYVVVLAPLAEDFMQKVSDKTLNPDAPLCQAVSEVCTCLGKYLGERYVPFDEYKKFYEYARSLDPSNLEIQRELASMLIKNGPTKVDSVRGAAMLEHIAQMAPKVETYEFLGFLYINGGPDVKQWILPNQAKARTYLRKAKEMKSELAQQLLSGMKLLEREPTIIGPAQWDINANIEKFNKIRTLAHKLYDGAEYDKALMSFTYLVKMYLDAGAALSMAIIYIENKQDYGRGGIALMQLIECLKAHGSSKDHGSSNELYLKGFHRMRDMLWDIARNQNNHSATLWASAVENKWKEFERQLAGQ